MTITLWGRLNSANVQKVVWALGELGLGYEHIPLGGSFGGNDSAEYRALNPNGLVPTLKDGELVIWESHAIVRYLAGQYGAGVLFPSAPATRALADQWTDWTATSFQPAWIGVFWGLVRTPESKRDAAAIAKGIAATVRCFEIMDGQLKRTPYLGGDALTYADLAAGVAMYRWTTMETGTALPPAVKDWHKRLNASPAFAKAVNLPYPEMVGREAF